MFVSSYPSSRVAGVLGPKVSLEGRGPQAVSSVLAVNAPSSQQSSPKKRRNKCFKNREEAKLILGIDISEPEVVDMEKLALVGTARGNRFNIKMLKDWEDNSWSFSIYRDPSVQTLSRDWLHVSSLGQYELGYLWISGLIKASWS
jgi:hypothetical protein